MEQATPRSDHVDVGARRVAHVYAQALLRAADTQDAEDVILEEYDSLVHDIFDKDARVEGLLSLAALGRKARAEVIEKVFAPRATPILTNFLNVLNDHDRLDLIRPVLGELRQLHDKRMGRARVQVVSAVPLNKEQEERLRGDLKQTFAFEPVLEAKVDPNLLGGLKVRIGDWQYDASVRTRLDNLRNLILARGSHEIQSRRDSFSS